MSAAAASMCSERIEEGVKHFLTEGLNQQLYSSLLPLRHRLLQKARCPPRCLLLLPGPATCPFCADAAQPEPHARMHATDTNACMQQTRAHACGLQAIPSLSMQSALRHQHSQTPAALTCRFDATPTPSV